MHARLQTCDHDRPLAARGRRDARPRRAGERPRGVALGVVAVAALARLGGLAGRGRSAQEARRLTALAAAAPLASGAESCHRGRRPAAGGAQPGDARP
jgi:hypothetical protein